MKIKISDVKFVINNRGYYIYELNDAQIDCLYTILNSTCFNMVKCKDVRILFPVNKNPYYLYELRVNQLFMLQNLLKRIKAGKITSSNVIVQDEIALSQAEKAVIRSMANNSMSITKVANELGIDRNTVYRNINKIKEKTELCANKFEHLTVLMTLLS